MNFNQKCVLSIYLCMVDYISRDLFYKSARFSDIFFLEKETKKRPKRRGSIFQVSKPYFIHIIYLHYHVFYPKTDQWSQVPKTVIFQVYISSLFLKWFFHTSILIWLVWHIKTVLSQLWWLVYIYGWSHCLKIIKNVPFSILAILAFSILIVH